MYFEKLKGCFLPNSVVQNAVKGPVTRAPPGRGFVTRTFSIWTRLGESYQHSILLFFLYSLAMFLFTGHNFHYTLALHHSLHPPECCNRERYGFSVSIFRFSTSNLYSPYSLIFNSHLFKLKPRKIISTSPSVWILSQILVELKLLSQWMLQISEVWAQLWQEPLLRNLPEFWT